MVSNDRRTTLPDSKPLLYFHGTSSSRKEWLVFGNDALVRQPGLRVVCVDRPGMGLSDCSPGRCILDWPADISVLADRLGLERFAALGYSGGAPYALACALSIPERLTAVDITACAGPQEIPGRGARPERLEGSQACEGHPG